MTALPEIAANIIAPILLVVGASVLADRFLAPDPRALSRLTLYLFMPFLVLDGVAHAQVEPGEAGQMIALALGVSFLVMLVAWGVARAAGYDRRLESAFLLSAVMINAGNYGVPLNEFAFGASGMERALIFFVVTVVISNTFGVYLASRGTASTGRALLNVLRVPLPYAALLGLLINTTHTTIPLPVDRAIKLLSQAAVPAMLVLLGVQLSRASRGVSVRVGPVLLASGMRLIVSPLIAAGLAVLLGLTGVTRQVSIVQSAMPTAVITGVLATEYGGDSEFVTAVILISTLLSILTLSVLLSLVM